VRREAGIAALLLGCAALAGDRSPEERFKALEPRWKSFKALPLASKENLATLLRETQTLEADYRKVIETKSPEWSIAALVMTGELFYDFAKKIDAVPTPKPMREEGEPMTIICTIDSSRLTDKAIETYDLALQKAKELSVKTAYTELAAQRLAELRPASERGKPPPAP
jgi:hypothetical protein